MDCHLAPSNQRERCSPGNGLYTRADIPFYYAVADAFTICDNYFCSALGPTDPNRLYTMAASIDPDGQNGGPILQTLIANRSSFNGRLTYTTMPEQLQTRGISWKVYSSPDENVLGGFFRTTFFLTSRIFRILRRCCIKMLSAHSFPRFSGGCRGRKPAASLLDNRVGRNSDHPPAPSLFGEISCRSLWMP